MAETNGRDGWNLRAFTHQVSTFVTAPVVCLTLHRLRCAAGRGDDQGAAGDAHPARRAGGRRRYSGADI